MVEYKMSCGQKVLYYAAVASLAMGFVIMSILLYRLFEPFKLPDIKQPMPVEPKVINRGEPIHFIIEYTKYNDAECVGTRTIQCDDGNLVTLTQVRTNLPMGEGITYSIPVIIPEKTSLGMCKLVIDVVYQVNPMKTVSDVYETEMFEVIK